MTDSTPRTHLVYHRVYPDARAKWGWYGESHFDTVKVEQNLTNAVPAPPFYLSENKPASGYLFYSFEPGWIGDWHLSPARQFMVILSGACEVETSDGNVKRFGPGDIILFEDTWGKGHRSGNISEDYLNFFVVRVLLT